MHSQINVTDFDLAATLECGQAFRWSRHGENGWFEGVVGPQVWRLRQSGNTLEWEVASSISHQPSPIAHRPSPIAIQRYLSLDVSLPQIAASFPAEDQHLHAAVQKHWGLRVLRQEPWECLASFMASSTKQIVQIRQIVAELARRFGEPIAEADGRAGAQPYHTDRMINAVGRDAVHRVHGRAGAQPYHADRMINAVGRDAVHRVHGRAGAQPYHSFPSVDAIARASHQELWDCKLGFRAKNLLAAARMIEDGKVDIKALPAMEYERALEELLKLPGVGEKIANCVLLFSCGFEQAFPVDVWIERALRRLYFPRRQATARQLREFARSHFGSHAGWAQQYLFFQERTRQKNRE